MTDNNIDDLFNRAERYIEIIDGTSFSVDVTNGWSVAREEINESPTLVADLVTAVKRLTPRVIETVRELDALPEGAVVRAEKVREGARRVHIIGSYFEKTSHRRNEWMQLDPGDRMDGEDRVDGDGVLRYFASGGRVIVLYIPEATR